jgi:hypothetical protein
MEGVIVKRAVLLACALWLAHAASTEAEIFRCKGPNGEVRFTSDAAQCPNGAPHAGKEGSLQKVEGASAPLASARPGAVTTARRSVPAAAAAASPAAEAKWRKKKTDAVKKVAELEMARAHAHQAVKWCNKGYGVNRENERTGLRDTVPCNQVDEEFAEIERQLAAARDYLATGLEEECRTSGCLPGWIRE